MKAPFKTDVSVLLLFFNRTDHFAQVWEQVKLARPARLFLYQDGPREGRDDMPGILACRALVCDDEIDWQCEVHRNYQEKNVGCDPAEYLSQQWAFSLTDKCIVLEDDDVPSQSFFPFCKAMLDRYADDPRVTLISGFNTDETTPDCPDDADYFFTRAFSIWGWASWSRVVLNWEGDYAFLRDKARLELLTQKVKQYKQRSDMVAMCHNHQATGKAYYESIFWAYMLLNDGLAIMPRLNLINNVGMDGGVHFSAQLDLLPKRMRRQFTMKRLEMPCFAQDTSSPTESALCLKHPTAVVEHPAYQRRYYLLNAWNAPWRKVQYSLEELWLNLCHGNFSHITSSLKNRILITLGMRKHK